MTHLLTYAYSNYKQRNVLYFQWGLIDGVVYIFFNATVEVIFMKIIGCEYSNLLNWIIITSLNVIS